MFLQRFYDVSEDISTMFLRCFYDVPTMFIRCFYVGSSAIVTRSNTLPSRRTLKNSRLVCKKDDVHVCVMCLRAIMNYQVTLPLFRLQTGSSFSLIFNRVLLFISMDSTWWCHIRTLSTRSPSASTTETPGQETRFTHRSHTVSQLNSKVMSLMSPCHS